MNRLFYNNMFSPATYTQAANVCIEHNHLDALDLIIQRPLVTKHPNWRWDSLCITALNCTNLQALVLCAKHIPLPKLANVYRFSITLGNAPCFFILHDMVDDKIRNNTANELSRNTNAAIFAHLFPFSPDPVAVFQQKFYSDDIDLCATLVSLRPEVKTWLVDQLSAPWKQEQAQRILDAVQRAEISAQLSDCGTGAKSRKM